MASIFFIKLNVIIGYFWSKATSGTHQTQTEDFTEFSDKHANTRVWDHFSIFLINTFNNFVYSKF